MMKIVVYTLTCSILAFGAATGPVRAQSAGTNEMTQDEILEAFKKQKTRGLAIAPASNTGSATVDPEEELVTEVSMDAIPKDEQVNINISFDFDSAALRADQKPKLQMLCQAVKGAEVQTLRILGHTDASGSAEYNERLSKLRAEEVKRFLAADCGIADEQMEAVGVGERFPFDAADPRADVNRRVEFQALS